MTPIENEPEKEHQNPIEPREISHRDWAEFAQLTGLMEMSDPAEDRLPKERRRLKLSYKWIFLTFTVLMLLLWLGLTNRNLAHGPQSVNNADTVNLQSAQTNQGVGKIVVDIHGDVHHPGVYELPANARVRDAITAAGGFVHAEDAQFINAAMALDDGQEVFVPGPAPTNPADAAATGRPSAVMNATNTSQTGTSEAPVANRVVTGTGNTTVARLDINTADQTSFETLPGIGPTRAAAIVEYRSQHGGFISITELQNVPGIGPKTWEKIQPYVIAAPIK